MNALSNFILLLFLVESSRQFSDDKRISTADDDQRVYPKEDDENILLWQDLKKQVQRIEKNRASDTKRIQKLEEENKRLRIDFDRLRTSVENEQKKGGSNFEAKVESRKNATKKRNRRSPKTASAEKSVEFLPAQFQMALQDEIIEDSRFAEPHHESDQFVQQYDDQQKKIDRLSARVESLQEQIASIDGCCSNKTDSDRVHADQPSEFSYSPSDLEQLKQRLQHTGITISQMQTNQFEMRDQQKWIIFQIEQINTELGTIDEDRKKIWTALGKKTTDGGVDQSSDSSEEKRDPKGVGLELGGGGGGESSGEADSSGWQSVAFVDDAVSNFLPDASSNRLHEVERTARDAFSLVTQMKTKLDAVEKDISKTMAMFGKVEKWQINQSELNAFTQTVDFVQEALVNVTWRLMENELVQEKQNSQMKSDLNDVLKRLRLLSLQTEKAKHLAQVVKDHQMDHFTAIQQFRHDLNSLETNVLRLGMKLTNFQTDVLNATLSTYKDNNKDLQQDVQIADLYTRIDRVDGKFPEIHQTMKDTSASMRSKAERAEVKNLGSEMQKLAEKLQITSVFNNSINSMAESVRLLETQLPTDCSMSSIPRGVIFRNGTYVIKPKGSSKTVLASCQIDTSTPDDIGWTIIQRRANGREDFNRTYEQYRYGFGDPKSDHWLGNEYIHMLTRQSDNLLRIDAWDIFGDYHFAEYGSFKVGSFDEGYRLELDHYSGNLTNALQLQSGMRFSAYDLDADASSTHCARYYASGWWFSNCQKANLNGVYPMGVIWFSSIKNDWLQLKKTLMKVRPIK